MNASCGETPFSIPASFDLTKIPINELALRLVAPVAGTGQVTPLPVGGGTPNGEGLSVSESTLAELRVNEVEGSASQLRNPLLDVRLCFPSAHSFPDTSVAELFLYFANGRVQGQWFCLSILCKVGVDADPTAAYFTSLTRQGNALKRPFLTTLFAPNDLFLEYSGADLRGRTQLNPTPSTQCDVPTYVRYFVCTTQISIGSRATLNRLIEIAAGGPGIVPTGPPRQAAASDPAQLVKIVSRVKGIQLGEPSSDRPDTKATKAMKCYRIDPEKDIKNGQVKLRPTSSSTLADEMTAKNAAIGKEGDASVQPGDVEFWVAFAFTIVFIIIGAGVAYRFGFVSLKPQTTAAAGGAGGAGGGAVVVEPPVSAASFLTMGFVAGIASLLILGLLYLSFSDRNSTSIVLILLMVVALIVPVALTVYKYVNRTPTVATAAVATVAAAGSTQGPPGPPTPPPGPPGPPTPPPGPPTTPAQKQKVKKVLGWKIKAAAAKGGP